jgi:hypothetical protein
MKRALSYLSLSVLVCALFVILVQRSGPVNRITVSAPQSAALTDKHGLEEESEEMDAPEEFERYYREIRTRIGDESPAYPVNYKMTEVNKANQAKAISLFKYVGLPWTERGPGNVGGRTRGLIVDPDDPAKNTWFVGSVSGGIWKTTNAGTTWVNKTPNVPNLATVTIVMAASNHSILYAGTGEGFSNLDAVRGDGIWKSTDRGETWNQISSTAGKSDYSYVNRVIVDPLNANNCFAATNTGIFHSTDGGNTWTTVYSGGGRVQQILENPKNFNTLYATRNGNGALKSTDRGLTWAVISDGIGAGARCEMTVSPVDTARLFLAMETSSSVSDLYVSDNGGSSWAKANYTGLGSAPNWLNGQGWYDNAITAHPYDRDICYVGGLDLYKIQLTGSVTQAAGVLSVFQNNTTGFLTFVNWGGPFGGGGIGSGKDFYGTTTAPLDLVDADYVPVVILFGPGVSQMAHRFNSGSSFMYRYLDYVSVPFQVWDVANNRQLMVSFRDSDSSGVFKLVPYDSNNPQREYIFVHAVPYDGSTPNVNIATTGGERYKNINALWPSSVVGVTWNPTLLPTSNLAIRNGLVLSRSRTSTKLTNWAAQSTSSSYVHADHHNITIIPVDQATQSFRIVHASDGGIATSINGGTSWSTVNLGYNTSQFYGVDKRPGVNVSQYIGGTQDNGTWVSTIGATATSIWTTPLGGDGFASAWHYKDASKVIASLYYNDLRKSINGGSSFQASTTDLTDIGSGNGPFITQIGKSNIDPDLLFVPGISGVWRSDNFGENWTLSKIALQNWGWVNGTGATTEISLADPQIVWAGVRMSNASNPGKINVSTDGGINFSTTNNALSSARLSGFASHPVQPRTAYALFSVAKAPKILRTTDLGQTWEDISGFGTGTVSTNGFPDVATYSMLVMPHNPSEIWAGTEIGLFISTNNGGIWAYANDVIPAVAIWQMRVVDDEVVVATHGRGIWSVKIQALLTAPPPVMTLSPRLNKSMQRPDGALSINVSLRSSYDSTRIFVKGASFATLAANALAKDTLVPFQVTKAESLSMSVTSYKNGKAYLSAPRGTNVIVPQAGRQNYVDNFDTPNTNFTLSGFSLQKPTGFTSQAYHTPHPYANNKTYTLTLNLPIVVQSKSAFVRFDEIVLVEPGETGSLFGTAAFYDYVVVEATKDGSNWIPLEDGYDARLYSEWLNAFTTVSTPTPSLLRKHEMNLLSKFAAGDLVFIRFRLWTDPGTTGWGWMIDNLEIQANLTSVQGEPSAVPATFSLSQNYPNPFNPSTTIRYGIPVESKVTLTIYDMLGRKIQTLVDRQLKPGAYAETWNASSLASGMYFYRIDARDATAGSNRRFSETKRLVLLK